MSFKDYLKEYEDPAELLLKINEIQESFSEVIKLLLDFRTLTTGKEPIANEPKGRDVNTAYQNRIDISGSINTILNRLEPIVKNISNLQNAIKPVGDQVGSSTVMPVGPISA